MDSQSIKRLRSKESPSFVFITGDRGLVWDIKEIRRKRSKRRGRGTLLRREVESITLPLSNV